jgi:sulfite oxidase
MTLIRGKISDMIVHQTKPLQVETPLTALNTHGLTDISHLYVRNNLGLEGTETTTPNSCKEWCLEVSGLVETPLKLSLAELKTFDHQHLEMVLQCSGNSRSFFNHLAPVEGSQWQHGTVANLEFSGIALKEILQRCSPKSAARYLTLRGAYSGLEAPFERSISLDDAHDTALLALSLNGQDLPAIHGGPLRFVIPGYYGVNHVKWVTRISLDDIATSSLYQTEKYRLPLNPLNPGQIFEPSLQNSRPSWRMNLKSIITGPLTNLTAGVVALTGVAWTDGRSHIARVEVSFDQGTTWRCAGLTSGSSPYAWSEWTYKPTLEPGKHEVWVKATTSEGVSQPLDASQSWNPHGYEYNAVDKVQFFVGA